MMFSELGLTSWPQNGRNPFVDVVAFGACRAVAGWVQRYLSQLFLDALGSRRKASSFGFRCHVNYFNTYVKEDCAKMLR
jgi:hypothetical protein